jgi:large-conductance mechanosensitive channel
MKEKKVKKGKLFTVGQEFKAFISRGNVLDMAVGVIMGSAFGAIVSAFTNILLSVCTWGVPGGLKGLVTVLPALNAGQAGMDVANGLGQSFDMSQLQTLATAEAKACGFDTANDVVIQNEMSTEWR